MADPGGGIQGWSPPPPWTCPPITPSPLECGWRHTGNVQGAGCVLVNVQESGGVFQFFGGRMTSRGQCPRGGGCACECPRVGAFFKLMTSRGQCPRGCCECLHPAPPSGNPVSAPGVPPIQVQTPPPPHLDGWLRAWCMICSLKTIQAYHLTLL